jgi:hypothetical protein
MTRLNIKTGPQHLEDHPRQGPRLTLGKLVQAATILFFLVGVFAALGGFERLPPPDRELTAALDRNDPEAARAALLAGALVSRRDLTGGTYLHTAAYRGQLALADVLVSQGLDPGVRDHAGVTPLHLAATEGHRELAEWLIRQGAPVEAKTTAFVECCDGNDFQVGFTPFDVARQAGQRQLVELLERAARR